MPWNEDLVLYLIIGSLVLTLAVLYFVVKTIKMSNAKEIPLDDEMSKTIRLTTGYNAFLSSHMMWIIIFLIESFVGNNGPNWWTFSGIWGMLLLYGVNMWYVKRKDISL
ncbi:MAG: hypothetical protein ACXAD7_01960 [Candidatus Kariarchaeaceae archaeon]|jgi:uncharacterized BrkB/YihY/UPF0761 family membrane protein